MVYFGINIGSSNVCLAVFKDDNAFVVANDRGDRVTPACLAVTNDETFVGITAKQQMIRNPQSVITDILASINGCTNGKSKFCKVIYEGDEIHYETQCEGKTISLCLNDALKLIFKKLLDIAQNHVDGNENLHKLVISVPQYFNPDQVNIITNSASKAGFHVLGTINRPTASILAYGISQKTSRDNMNVLVFRVGGISSDVSLFKIRGGLYFLINSVHKESLGGDYFTDLLSKYLLNEFLRSTKCDASDSKRTMAKLRSASENCKHILSTIPTSHCFIESLYDGLDFSANVSRARFDSLISPYISSYIQPIASLLQSEPSFKDSISKVILTGGTLKTPKLQQAVVEMFPNAEILYSLPPDEATAKGAAMHAALIGGHCREIESTDDVDVFLPSLYLKINGEENENSYTCIMPSDTPIPARQQHTLKVAPNCTSARLSIYSKLNDEEYVHLANIILKDLSSDAEICFTVQIKSDGAVHLTANQKNGEQTESLIIPMEKSS